MSSIFLQQFFCKTEWMTLFHDHGTWYQPLSLPSGEQYQQNQFEETVLNHLLHCTKSFSYEGVHLQLCGNCSALTMLWSGHHLTACPQTFPAAQDLRISFKNQVYFKMTLFNCITVLLVEQIQRMLKEILNSQLLWNEAKFLNGKEFDPKSTIMCVDSCFTSKKLCTILSNMLQWYILNYYYYYH